MNLDNYFNPKSVAVIGASSDKSKVGYAIMANLMSQKNNDAPLKVFPISISEKEIMGLATHSSIKEISENVDLAVIAIRSDFVPGIIEECATKNIKTITIISAGFREVGPAGLELEEKCARIAKEHGITVLGPNCLGTINTGNDFNASFAATMPQKGHIAFLSQSGALGTSLLDVALSEGIGFSKFISLGNEAMLSEVDFLNYLANDKETKSILIYLEKLSDGPAFMKLCKEITKTKPIVVLKAGRSARGIKAVASHTGSLAPEDTVFSAALKQSGVIAVESIREFFNMAKLFELGITKPVQKFAILTNGGGPSVVAADLVDLSRSLSLVEFDEQTKESLRKVLPSMAAVGNPVDIIGDALSARYKSALEILCSIPDLEGIIMILTPQMMTEVDLTAKLINEFKDKKIIIPVFIGGPSVESGLKVFREYGLVNFRFPKDAVEVLDSLAFGKPKQQNVGSSSKGGSSELEMMPFLKMMDILSEYDIRIDGTLLNSKKEILPAISKLGKGPYVLKAISPDLLHKTDAGVIKLSLKTYDEVRKAWDYIDKQIQEKYPTARIEGYYLQVMKVGRETIVGMKRDPVFGPTILFGLGGIFTEAIKDTVAGIAPIDMDMALKMISSIKGQKILDGLHGEKPADREALAEVLIKISDLAIKYPEIMEIDLNPVVAMPTEALFVDARMMIKK